MPLEQLRDRFAATSGFKGQPDKVDMREAAALLGGVSEPPFTVSRCLELYWTLAKDKIRGKSQDQVRRWENLSKAKRNQLAVVLPKIADAYRGRNG